MSEHSHVCMVIGDPIEHSLSPLMHSAGYQSLGIEDQFCFTSAHVNKDELSAAIAGVRALGIRGVSVTLPHKKEVCAYLDEVDGLAERTGAVNTIVNTESKLTGYNTDCVGFVEPLRAVRSLDEARVVVLGAGGAARAAIAALSREGGLVTVANRTEERARKVAHHFNVDFTSLDDTEVLQEADIIIDTTPLGMAGNKQMPIDPSVLREGQIVFDAVYTPYWTPLLLAAKERKAHCIHGIDMFVAQGAAQFELYTGHTAPEKAMRAAVADALHISKVAS